MDGVNSNCQICTKCNKCDKHIDKLFGNHRVFEVLRTINQNYTKQSDEKDKNDKSSSRGVK